MLVMLCHGLQGRGVEGGLDAGAHHRLRGGNAMCVDAQYAEVAVELLPPARTGLHRSALEGVTCKKTRLPDFCSRLQAQDVLGSRIFWRQDEAKPSRGRGCLPGAVAESGVSALRVQAAQLQPAAEPAGAAVQAAQPAATGLHKQQKA